MPPKEELIASSSTPVALLLFGARCFPGGIFWTVLPTIQLGTSEDKYVILRKRYPIGNPFRGQKIFTSGSEPVYRDTLGYMPGMLAIRCLHYNS